MLNKDNIDQLLLKHLLQENAVEEEQLLKEWLGHDPEHMVLSGICIICIYRFTSFHWPRHRRNSLRRNLRSFRYLR